MCGAGLRHVPSIHGGVGSPREWLTGRIFPAPHTRPHVSAGGIAADSAENYDTNGEGLSHSPPRPRL